MAVRYGRDTGVNRRRSTGRRDGYDRHGYDRGHRSHGGGGSWWVWIVVIAAVVMWGSSKQGDGTPRQDTPRDGNSSTVCTQYFRGGC